jgi:flagella basal body P-ring formation protein FlgA
MRIILSLILLLIACNAEATTLGAEKDILQKQIYAQLSGNPVPLAPLQQTVKVPALKTKMQSGDVISAQDITYVNLDARKVERGYIVTAKDLIGKSPARVIFANRAIMAREITAQTLVEEKKAVTIYFKNSVIEMQDMGVALEDGALGDFIRVKNTTSNIVISGKVIAENLVEVAPQGAILAKN